MRISKILFIILISLVVLISWSGFPLSASAEEDELIAQLARPGTTTQVTPKLDCKATQEKDKDGKIIVKLDGKGCTQVVDKIGASGQTKVCCVCRGDGSGTHWVCDGTCCVGAIGKIVKITR